jgi:hypothetical protein
VSENWELACEGAFMLRVDTGETVFKGWVEKDRDCPALWSYQVAVTRRGNNTALLTSERNAKTLDEAKAACEVALCLVAKEWFGVRL